MLKGYEPWKYKVAYKLFPGAGEGNDLSPLGEYLWEAIEGIGWPQKPSELWNLKERLDKIKNDFHLSDKEIREGFKLLLNACYKNADPRALMQQQSAFDGLLAIDPEIPYGAIEY